MSLWPLARAALQCQPASAPIMDGSSPKPAHPPPASSTSAPATATCSRSLGTRHLVGSAPATSSASTANAFAASASPVDHPSATSGKPPEPRPLAPLSWRRQRHPTRRLPGRPATHRPPRRLPRLPPGVNQWLRTVCRRQRPTRPKPTSKTPPTVATTSSASTASRPPRGL